MIACTIIVALLLSSCEAFQSASTLRPPSVGGASNNAAAVEPRSSPDRFSPAHRRRPSSPSLSPCGLRALPDPSSAALQLASAGISYLALLAYFDRPRGKLLVPPSSLRVASSQVPGAGLGLYAAESLPAGTILGTYPGVVVPLSSNLRKLESYPECAVYTWRFTDNEFVIDPTDGEGKLQGYATGGSVVYPLSRMIMENLFGFWRVPTYFARINEPPIGKDCNILTEEDLVRREVVFSVGRDVYEGEELFIDYGLTYDRSGYGGGDGKQDDNDR